MGMLDGKVAIVTGAGHGIGRGHALELAKHGAKVVMNDLGVSVKGEGQGRDADLTVDIIKGRGGEAVARTTPNVSDYDAAGEMIAQAVDTFGKLDILVNNAGIVRDGSIFNMTVEDFDAVLKVHLRGHLDPLQARRGALAGAVNKATGAKVDGRIINTVSGAGLTGNFGQTNYATGEGRRSPSLTQTLSLELLQDGRHRERRRPGRRDAHHRHHARRPRGDRGRRRARG
jgi:NAD(P)-dependent dehydrogenase (short-subunit alcohol dehydrogenase family)